MYEKRKKRKAGKDAQCTELCSRCCAQYPSPAVTSLHAMGMRGMSLYYRLQRQNPGSEAGRSRSHGGAVFMSGGGAESAPQVRLGFRSCISGSKGVSINPVVPVVHCREERALGAGCAAVRWTGRRVPLVIPRGQRESVSLQPGAEGQFKLSDVPRAPSAPPSEMGIFCSLSFWNLDLVFQCLRGSLLPRCQ